MRLTNRPSNLRALALAACLALPAAACDDDSGSTTPVTDTQDATTDTGGDASPEAVGTDCELAKDPVGTTFFVDSLVLEQPDALKDIINDLWAKDIEVGRFILLFHIAAYDAATGAAQVSVGTGVIEEDVYKWGETPSTLNLQFDGCQFVTVGDAQITLNPATVSKPIVVSTLDVTGVIDADVTTLAPANLTGGITKTNAAGLDVLLDPEDPENSIRLDLLELLEGAGVPAVDTDNDGEGDTFELSGTLTGTVVTNVDLTE